MKQTQIDLIKEESKKQKKAKKPITAKYKFYNSKTGKTETRERVIKSGKEGNSFKKILLITALICLELVFLIFLYVWFIIAFLWFLFIPYGLSIIFSCRVAVSNKNYDSKIAWILFLLILAPVAVLIYLLAGEINSSPFKIRRMKKINRKTKFLSGDNFPYGIPERVKQDCTFIQNASDFAPFFKGATKYFPTGEEYFEDVLTELKKAEKFIFMDFFIIDKGYLSDAIFKILIEKSKAGVDVRIIVDGLGSHGTLNFFKVRKIRKHGIRIMAFEPVIPIINFFVNYRNHRKLIVIDGRAGYLGGANIADEYINAKRKFGLWKDAALRIDGEAVKSMTLIFLRMWEYSSKEKIDYKAFLNETKINKEQSGKTVIVPYADGINEPHRLGKNVYCNIISNARKSLYIMSPYLIIDRNMIDMLIAKAQSGVDVRIIIPGIPDKKIIYSLTCANAEKLASGGVKIYKYSPGFLHGKVMVSDNECAVVGSINMDFRSFYQQYENAAYISEAGTLQAIVNDFEQTFNVSKLISPQDIKKRNIFKRTWLAFIRLFAPLM